MLDAARAHQGRLRSSFPSDNSRNPHEDPIIGAAAGEHEVM